MLWSSSIPDLVGREQELSALGEGLGASLSGRGTAFLIVGEPGIGKTRTIQAFSARAASAGMLVLSAQVPEQPGIPPYWPWVQVLRQLTQLLDEQELRDALGPGACCIADICPELRDRLPDLPLPQPLADPGQARFRLFDAMAQAWRRVAAARPVLLILDDLHWADPSSLQLLEFCAGELADCRALIVATAQDADGSDQQPVRNALADLQRKMRRLSLTGLSREQTGLLATAIAGTAIPDAVIGFVHGRTAGNPFFVSELARWLVQQGMLARADLVPGVDPARPLRRLPGSIRALIGARLGRLSAMTRELLQRAAVIGVRFNFGLLRRLFEDLSEDQLLAELDHALAAQIIEELSERGLYQFTHALTRDTLYDEIPARERARLHQNVASAMESDYQHSPGPPLWLLAHHFNAALPSGSGAKAVAYAIAAGEQASRRLAHEEAARCFALALNALDQTGSADAELRCKVTIGLGRAQLRSGHPLSALHSLSEAANRASHVGARKEMAEAAIDFEEVSWRLGLPGADAVRLLEVCLEHVDETDTMARTRLQSALVRALVFAGTPERADRLHRETVQLARQADNPHALEVALRSGFWVPWEPAQLDALLACAQEAYTLARQFGNPEGALDAAAFRLHLLMAVGDYAGFSIGLDRFTRLAEELQQPFHRYHATLMRAAQALMNGRLADAEALARAAVRFAACLPGLHPAGAFSMQMFALAQERGELLGLAPQLQQFMQNEPRAATWRPALALVLAELGQHDKARGELEQLALRHFQVLARDGLWLAALVYLTQACVLCEDRARAQELYTLLVPWQGRILVGGSLIVCFGPADHFLGMLCATVRRWESAERHFAAAIQTSQREGFGPWLARTHYQYAAMLLHRKWRGDHARARASLESAGRLAASLDMTGLSVRVTQLERSLESRPQTPALPGGLSRREALVLQMVASGKSNREIAAAIFRSPNTVANHVRSILAKLGAANRTEAAAFAARHGLL